MVKTGQVIPTLPGEQVVKAVMWDGGPVGLEGSYFPDPAGWTFTGANAGQTLERVTVRLRTALHRSAVEVEPSCVSKWPEVLGEGVPMREVWRRFSNPLAIHATSKARSGLCIVPCAHAT